ncbi:protein tyrosine phosphatase [Bracoviriform facetosae]|uniref:Protein tyrosine phosphatase n=1 Tax=Bracoviriform facetosae TaxID=2083300 RepID=B8PQ77_9VIRU|nr:protein tyrosine phosphatase [Bracoviriform facetosae]ACE75503.1 protein tyrosine phosphatase [Bracoviriform facetosae]
MTYIQFHYFNPISLWRRVNQLDFASVAWAEYIWIMAIEESGTWEAFAKLENMEKNRNSLVPCWDHTRVKLTTDESASDYIHANYVDGFEEKKKFICTQAPKINTLVDFYQMTWRENSCIIIMLVNVTPSCFQYWPSKKDYSLQVGKFTITNTNVEMFFNYIATDLTISDGSGESRKIRHFLYTGWTQNDTPDNVAEFYQFVQRTNQARTLTIRSTLKLNQNRPGPIIVHCNTGIGRTGAFCTVDIALFRMMKTASLSIPEIVSRIRQQRHSSVITFEQYFFCYRILMHFLSHVFQKSNYSKHRITNCTDEIVSK